MLLQYRPQHEFRRNGTWNLGIAWCHSCPTLRIKESDEHLYEGGSCDASVYWTIEVIMHVGTRKV